MYFTDYSSFYNNVIEQYIKELISVNQKTSDYAKAIKLRKNAKNKIFNYYQRRRDEVKTYYMDKSVVALDSHKVAACLMYAILKAKPIKINKLIPNLPQEVILANEYIAIFTAFNVIDIFKRRNFPSYKTVVPTTYLDEQNSKDGTYVSNLCKALHFIKNLNCFDTFAYANILFMLEKYTDVTVKSNS